MCPECRGKKITNENTGRRGIVFGGTTHNTCQNCGCQWIYCCATGSSVTVHGSFFNAIDQRKRSDHLRF